MADDDGAAMHQEILDYFESEGLVQGEDWEIYDSNIAGAIVMLE